jgi:hypothetical protein
VKRLVTLVAVAACMLTPAAAQAGPPKMPSSPGNPIWRTEQQAEDYLEQVVDHAYCDGIPRFGRKGPGLASDSWPSTATRSATTSTATTSA